jgi:hypothetical protein
MMHYIRQYLLVFLLISGGNSYAQRMIVKNLEKYDSQWIHFGFLLGVNNTDFKVTRNDNFYKQDSAIVVTPRGRAGFNLGIIADASITSNLNIQFAPALSFAQRDLEYQMVYPNKKKEIVLKKVESTFIEFPLEFKLRSNRINNYRIYVISGGKYMIDMVSQAKVENDEQLVKLARKDYGYTVGLGFDFYMPLFKFSPEIKMYQGIPNLLVTDPAVYTTSLKSLKSRIFSISLIFE